MWRSDIWKDPDAGKDWRREEKATPEDEMIGWHHWLKGHEFEQAPGNSERPGSLWGGKESDTTEWLNNKVASYWRLWYNQFPSSFQLLLEMGIRQCLWYNMKLTELNPACMYNMIAIVSFLLFSTACKWQARSWDMKVTKGSLSSSHENRWILQG